MQISPLKSLNIGALDACFDAFTYTLCTQLLFEKNCSAPVLKSFLLN